MLHSPVWAQEGALPISIHSSPFHRFHFPSGFLQVQSNPPTSSFRSPHLNFEGFEVSSLPANSTLPHGFDTTIPPPS
jgi:hypothetical protein